MYKVEKTWRSIDYPCVVVMSSLGHRRGYVGIPPTHPLYNVAYHKTTHKLQSYWDMIHGQRKVSIKCLQVVELLDHDNFGVMGAFLFMGESNRLTPESNLGVHGGVTYSDNKDNYPSTIQDHWWFGYDCDHLDDAKDLSVVSDQIRELEEKYPTGGVIRSLNYCFYECVKLADQLREIETNYNIRREILFRSFQ